MPVAVDQHVFRQRKDAEGELFAKVLKQAGRDTGGFAQGVYLFTAEGKLLGFSNTADATQVKNLLNKALTKFDPSAPAPKLPAAKVGDVLPPSPSGGLILDVTAKMLGGYAPDDQRGQRYLKSLGRDHLWIRKDETEALGKGLLLDSVKERLVRFHLIDNTRGEPPMWSTAEIKKLELTLRDGRLLGTVHLETKSGDRGYQAAFAGFLEAHDGRVTRFDLLAKGEFWGEGNFSKGAPKGRFPLAIAFRLTDIQSGPSKVPPQGARGNMKGYLK